MLIECNRLLCDDERRSAGQAVTLPTETTEVSV